MARKTRSPAWDEEFTFSGVDESTVLTLTMFDKNKVGNDTPTGQVSASGVYFQTMHD